MTKTKEKKRLTLKQCFRKKQLDKQYKMKVCEYIWDHKEKFLKWQKEAFEKNAVHCDFHGAPDVCLPKYLYKRMSGDVVDAINEMLYNFTHGFCKGVSLYPQAIVDAVFKY